MRRASNAEAFHLFPRPLRQAAPIKSLSSLTSLYLITPTWSRTTPSPRPGGFKNIGTCTWTPSYAVTYISGDPMSAVYPAPLTSNVAPGQSVDVSVNMVSPSAAGTYKGNWGLKNAVGTVFSLGTYSNIPFWVLITVGGGGPYPTPVPGACTNKAAFVSDVTVPDNSYLSANTAFTKIWRLKNTGTCTWNTAYSTTFVSGDPMSAVYPVALPYTVVPGQSVDVAVNMVAPSYAGTYKGNWSLKSNTGQVFALGSAANVPFYVLIQVIGGTGATPDTSLSDPDTHSYRNRYNCGPVSHYLK